MPPTKRREVSCAIGPRQRAAPHRFRLNRVLHSPGCGPLRWQIQKPVVGATSAGFLLRRGRFRSQAASRYEYDAAQERGEVRGHGNKRDIPLENITPTITEIGSKSLKAVPEARIIRDAEKADPGVVQTA